MAALFGGLLVVGIVFGLLILDMERKRRALAEIVDRLEPLAPRNRRLALHNLRRLSRSLFYAQNLMGQVERQLAALEQEKGIASPSENIEGRFLLHDKRKLATMRERLVAIEGTHEPASAVTSKATLDMNKDH